MVSYVKLIQGTKQCDLYTWVKDQCETYTGI